MAFTSDASGRWSGPWLSWGEFSRFWDGVVRWTLPEQEQPGKGFSVDLARRDDTLLVEVFSREEVGRDHPALAQVTRPDGKSEAVPLAWLAPGHYLGSLDAAVKGTYRFMLTLPTGERLGPLGYTLSAPRALETPRPLPNVHLLEALADATGTSLIADPASLPAGEGRAESLPLLPHLIGLAMALYLADLILRRLLV